MSSGIYNVFQEIEAKARVSANYWQNFYEEIAQHLPESYQPEMQELSAKLETALENLVHQLHNPTLTLATTGTTSSGKSMLVNFLCGAEIMPVAISEMSAGVVTVEYSREKSLTIEETPAAAWECGEWYGITDQEISKRLYDTMRAYLDQREQNVDLACPKAVVRYPFRILKDLNLALPSGTTVRILDLPGLAHVGDESNAEVIRRCREALCLVTYNCAETDARKVKNLLQEVVQQVKELGGSPARMLFILNRIDVFRADRNWPESEDRFVEKTTASIKSELLDQLKEYTPEIESLEVIKLSTWPALLGLQLQQNQDVLIAVEASKRADNHFNGLIDEEILEDLPRKYEKWSDRDRVRVGEALWKKSYGSEFQKMLQSHVTSYFPQLVIPQMIERFNVHAGNAVVEWAVQTTSAVLNSSQENYEQECQKINEIRQGLDAFLNRSDEKLRQPFQKIDTKFSQVLSGQSEDDPISYLEKTIKSDLQQIEPYSELGDKLYPIYGWRRDMGRGIQEVLEGIAESLQKGQVNLDNSHFQKANPIQIRLLEKHLNRLISLGYTGAVAKNGEQRVAKTSQEKQTLQYLNDTLNELADHLSIIMEEILSQICDQSGSRIYDAINELFKFHLERIEEGSCNVAPDMGIKFPESQLIKIEQQPKFTINFQAGFAVTEGTWQEDVQVSYEERIWWTLWLVKQTKYRTEYKTRSSDNADIPKVVTLLEGWIIQAKEAESQIVRQTSKWFLDQINLLKKNVKETQDEILDRYQTRLDKANQEIEIDYERKKNVWEPVYRQALNLSSEFAALGKISNT